MNKGTTLTFGLPQGWTLRKVATALAREWLPQLRAEPAPRAPRWVLQPIVEDPSAVEGSLWEPGISTEEYEERLERSNLRWAIRATAGRGKGTILARLTLSEQNPDTVQVECLQGSLPEALFDQEKLGELLKENGQGTEALFAAILADHGFQPTAQ